MMPPRLGSGCRGDGAATGLHVLRTPRVAAVTANLIRGAGSLAICAAV